MKKKIAIIGAGFSGLSAAAYAAKDGHEVHVFEQHKSAGGRARNFQTANGYTFDMGPSWYWMPDIFENFFKDFGYRVSDFYDLISLNPQFEMVFADEVIAIPEQYVAQRELLESLEPDAGKAYDRFMRAARHKYQTAMQDFVFKPCLSWWEFVSPKMALNALKLDLLSDFRSYVKKFFRNPKVVALMEFPVIFLGASPAKIPAMYSLMNYGGYALGTWYPMGGFYQVVAAMQKVAEEQGAQFHFNTTVEKIEVKEGAVHSIVVEGVRQRFDVVLGAADYHHIESMLDEQYKNYNESYWSTKTFAPSCLIFYLGLRDQLPGLKHHTLFFEHELDGHISEIYDHPKWPSKPLFYVCCPSKTDKNVAPEGHENLFLLMPLAIGIEDDESIREQYFKEMIQRLERHTGIPDIQSKIDYKRSYCVSDFVGDYNAYKGNAYGLANTLNQTAVLKPSMKSKRVRNLFYTGQLTAPGPGVPPSIISGKVASTLIANKSSSTISHNA